MKLECYVCDSDIFRIYIKHQVNGSDDTYEIQCCSCGEITDLLPPEYMRKV